MRNVSDIAGIKPQITGTLYYYENGSFTTKSLNNGDFKANTFAVQSGTSNPNEFTIGACVIGALNFTLMNDTGKFSGIDWYDSRVSITLDFGSNKTITYEYYWVVKHHEIGQLITVECYDALKILDEYNLYELTQNYGITFPCSVSQILTALSQEHGFVFSGCSGTNIQLEDPKNEQMTQRALLSYIAQLCGQYVKAYGIELRFGWYNLSSTTHVGTSFSHDLRTSNITITGVKVSSYDDTATAEEPSGGSTSPIEIEDNPFITATNVATVASTIYSALGSGMFSYRPGDVDILSNAAIEAGDALLVDTGEEQNVLVLATNITYKPQLRESIDSDAEPYAGDLRINRSSYIKKQAQNSIDEELKDPTSELSQAIANAGGGDTEVIVLNAPYTVQAGNNPPYAGFQIDSNGITPIKITSWQFWNVYYTYLIVPKYKPVGVGLNPTFNVRMEVCAWHSGGLTCIGWVDFDAVRLRDDVIELSSPKTLSTTNMPTSSASSQDVNSAYIIWPRLGSGSHIYLIKSTTPDQYYPDLYTWYAAGYIPSV